MANDEFNNRYKKYLEQLRLQTLESLTVQQRLELANANPPPERPRRRGSPIPLTQSDRIELERIKAKPANQRTVYERVQLVNLSQQEAETKKPDDNTPPENATPRALQLGRALEKLRESKAKLEAEGQDTYEIDQLIARLEAELKSITH